MAHTLWPLGETKPLRPHHPIVLEYQQQKHLSPANSEARRFFVSVGNPANGRGLAQFRTQH